MKQDQVQILHAKFGKVIEIDYFDKTDSRNHSIEDEEIVHPDLRKALMAFKDDVAEAYYSVSHSLSEYIVPNEVTVTEKKGQFFLTVKGKFSTSHEDEVGISSGAIPMADDPTDELVVKLNTLRTELWEYFWNEKNAQQKIPFEGEKEKVQEENTILENS
jgi:hypothetical protein